MATRKQDRQEGGNPLLGQMMQHLIGIVAHRFPINHERDKNIAACLGVSAAAWARMKSGSPVDEGKLSRLVRYFRLDVDYGLTYDLFRSDSLEEFKRLLVDRGVGADEGDHIDRLRRILLNARNTRTTGIAFEKRRTPTRAGGIGPIGRGQLNRKVFRVGDEVAFKIAHPRGGGVLIVLNDSPLREFTCLMPSEYAPRVAVMGSDTFVPTEDGIFRSFQVWPPPGRYRLCAIWLRAIEGQIASIVDGAADLPPRSLTPNQIRHLANRIEHLDCEIQEKQPRYEISIGEYYVAE